MLIDEFLIALGVKADTKKVEEFDKAMDGVADSADKTEGAMARAYEATDGFVSGIEGIMGVLGFFTGTLGAAWGIFHGTIMELEDLIKEEKLLTEVTKKQLEQQKKYKESVETLGKRFQSLKVELAFGFLPTMQKTITAIDNFLKANKDAIVNGITVFLKWISSAVGAFGNFLRGLNMLIDKTIGWKNTLLLLAGAFLWLKRAAILAFVTTPLGLFLIALTAIILLVDDFMTYMDGGESLFGEYWGAMIGWVKDNEEALRSLWDMLVLGMSYLIEFGFFVTKYLGGALIDVVVAIIAAFELLVSLFSGNTAAIKENWDVMCMALLSAFTNLAMLFDPLVNWIAGLFVKAFTAAKDYVLDIFNQIIAAISSFVSSVGAVLSSVFTIVTTPFRLAFDWIVQKFSELPSLVGGIVSKLTFGLSDKVGAAVNNVKNSVVNNNNTQAVVNVNGAGNPQAVGNATAGAINKTSQMNTRGAAKA